MLAGTLARSHGFADARTQAISARRLLAVVLIILIACLMIDPAFAAKKKKRAVSAYKAPRQSEFVVDVNTGQVLHSLNPDVRCYPASLTKVMTLYMLFAQIDAGKLSLNDRLRVSAFATRQAPSKLGFTPGDTISVRDAILALVTKSANDVAVTVAENIGGSEPAFASRMTSTARRLGMMNTQFVNASGLPNPRQLTTARDMAILAVRIRRDFPQYYAYFSTSQFAWRGQVIKTHNHLLGKYQGTNGVKTGYTAASGFNLTTAVDRNGKRVVGVVLGGSSVSARDRRMMAILDDALPTATSKPSLQIASLKTPPLTGGVSATVIASNDSSPAPAVSPSVAAAATPAKQMSAISDEGDDDEAAADQPATKTTVTTAIAPAPALAPVPVAAPVEKTVAIAQTQTAPAPQKLAKAETSPRAQPVKVARADVPLARPAKAAQKSLATNVADMLIAPAEASTGAVSDRSIPRDGDQAPWKLGDPLFPKGTWVIQIGAYSDPDLAVSRIKQAIKLAPTQLKKVVPATVAVKTDSGKTLYRSRFGGFKTEAAAKAACGHLGRKSFTCIAIPPARG